MFLRLWARLQFFFDSLHLNHIVNGDCKFRTYLNSSSIFKILLKKCFSFYLCAKFKNSIMFLSSIEYNNHAKMMYNRLTNSILVLLFTFSFSALFAQDQAAVEAGKALFKNNCASCHNKNMKDKLTGPALAGLQERWSAFPESDLYSWIRNSQGMVAKGHPRAVQVFNEYNKQAMTSFPTLSASEWRLKSA